MAGVSGKVVVLDNANACRLCQRVRPLADFPTYWNAARGKTIVRAVCVECGKKRGREYKAKKRENDPAFYQRELERNKSYRDRYPNGYRKLMLEKRKKDKALYHSDVVVRLIALVGSFKRRAEKKGVQFDISAEFLHVMIHAQQFRCAATGVQFDIGSHSEYFRNPAAPSIDRIDNDKGYTIDNVQLVCAWYNLLKNEWSDSDVRSFVFTAYHTMFGGR